MRITLLQQEIKWGFKAHNLETFGHMIQEHYGKTDLVVLPEMFSTGFCVNQPELAESTDGEAIQQVKKWASEGNFAVAGSIMATDGVKSYNRGFFCKPDGTIQYADKRHLFIGDEARYFAPGKTHLDVTYMDVRFRLLICYDLRFPVWSRNPRNNPYDVLIYVANWPKDRIDAWDVLTQARAIENQAYLVGVNAVGHDTYNIHHNGHSVLLDPRGKSIVSFLDEEVGAKTGEIDMDKLAIIRKRFPFQAAADNFEVIL